MFVKGPEAYCRVGHSGMRMFEMGNDRAAVS